MPRISKRNFDFPVGPAFLGKDGRRHGATHKKLTLGRGKGKVQ